MRRFLIPVLLLLLLSIQASRGHDSPVHRVDGLTARLEAEGPRLDLLMDRAFEYNALGDWSLAVADFEAALRHSPGFWPALSGCAEAYLQLGEWDRVVLLARQGLDLRDDPATEGPLYALLARALMEQEKWEPALQAWRGALQSPQPQIDWFLGEAEALNQLNRLMERVNSLARARTRNASIVLERSWIQAMLDAGHYDDALPEIEKGISRSRWKSSWLLMRARVYRSTGLEAEAVADAVVALEEVASRLDTRNPDPDLIKQKKQARVFLAEHG